ARGLRECLRFGTTLVGDISAQGMSWELLEAAALRAVVFYEMIGLQSERAAQSLGGAWAWLHGLADSATCRPGLSPHAPYSVGKTLFAAARALASAARIPLAVHLAETRAELELLRERRGPFKKFLSELGAWNAAALVGSPGAVMKLCDAAV